MNKPPVDIRLGPLFVDIATVQLTQEDYDVLTHPLVGGVILFARNFENKVQVTQLARQIKSLRNPQLLICVDQEGGPVQRFKNEFTKLPPLHSVGGLYQKNKAAGLKAARTLARVMAYELRNIGIDFSLAPVVDLYSPDSQIIAKRAFHRDPWVVGLLATAYMDGLHDLGMTAVAKHFPGHGGVAEDSHLCLPRDNRCFKQVNESDLIPYRQLVNKGLDGIMTAHVRFKQIDRLPSGFSQFWIKQILRQKLGFKGIIFSDDLVMKGATEFGNIIDRTQLALNAGCDIALICNDRPALEQVLSDPTMQGMIKINADLQNRCRRHPRLDNWHPDMKNIVELIHKIEQDVG